MMRNGEIKADVLKIRRMTISIREDAELFAASLGSLRDSVNRMAAAWKGEASDAFRAGMYEDFRSMQAVGELLEKLAEDFGFAADEYTKNGQKAEEILSGI